MIDNELHEQLNALSEQYNFDQETLKKWYRKLLYHPEINPNKLLECLSELCSRRRDYYTEFKRLSNRQRNNKNDYELLEFCQNNDLDTDIERTIQSICKPNKVLKKDS